MSSSSRSAEGTHLHGRRLVLARVVWAAVVVYIGSYDNHLYAFNAQTGVQLWSAPTGNTIYSSPVVTNGMVYVGSDDDHLYAYALPPGNQLKPPARPNLKLAVRP